jgi:hypothetical protein
MPRIRSGPPRGSPEGQFFCARNVQDAQEVLALGVLTTAFALEHSRCDATATGRVSLAHDWDALARAAAERESAEVLSRPAHTLLAIWGVEQLESATASERSEVWIFRTGGPETPRGTGGRRKPAQ